MAARLVRKLGRRSDEARHSNEASNIHASVLDGPAVAVLSPPPPTMEEINAAFMEPHESPEVPSTLQEEEVSATVVAHHVVEPDPPQLGVDATQTVAFDNNHHAEAVALNPFDAMVAEENQKMASVFPDIAEMRREPPQQSNGAKQPAILHPLMPAPVVEAFSHPHAREAATSMVPNNLIHSPPPEQGSHSVAPSLCQSDMYMQQTAGAQSYSPSFHQETAEAFAQVGSQNHLYGEMAWTSHSAQNGSTNNVVPHYEHAATIQQQNTLEAAHIMPMRYETNVGSSRSHADLGLAMQQEKYAGPANAYSSASVAVGMQGDIPPYQANGVPHTPQSNLDMPMHSEPYFGVAEIIPSNSSEFETTANQSAITGGVTCTHSTTNSAHIQDMRFQDNLGSAQTPASPHFPDILSPAPIAAAEPQRFASEAAVPDLVAEDMNHAFPQDSKQPPITTPATNSFSEEERTPSVEEVLQASLLFDRTSSSRRESSESAFGHLYPSRRDLSKSLYPDIRNPFEDLATNEEGKRKSFNPLKAASATYDTDQSFTPLSTSAHQGPAAARGVAVFPQHHSASTEEATVLQTDLTHEGAMDQIAREDAALLAAKMAAYRGETRQRPYANVSIPDEEATVVAITEHDVHPSEIDNNAVRAELIGAQYGGGARAEYSGTYQAHPMTSPDVAAVAVDVGEFETAEEVAVLAGETTWNSPYTGQAFVMQDNTSSPYMERKPPARTTEDQFDNTHATAQIATSNQLSQPVVAVNARDVAEQAEFVGITEELSPTDMLPRGTYAEEAEFVGISEQISPTDMLQDGTTYAQQAEVVGISEGLNPTDMLQGGTYAEEAEVVGISEQISPTDMLQDSAYAQQAEVVGLSEGLNPTDMLPGGTYAEEAEVVGISEQISPTDMLQDGTYAEQAEVVGISEGLSPTDMLQNETYAEQAEVVDVTEELSSTEMLQSETYVEQAEVVDITAQVSATEIFQGETYAEQAEVVGISEELSTTEVLQGDAYTEQAEVVGITDELSPTAMLQGETRAELIGQEFNAQASAVVTNEIAFAEEQAEVLNISEEVHPSEREESEPRAELIGQDYTCSVGVPSAQANANIPHLHVDVNVQGTEFDRRHDVDNTEQPDALANELDLKTPAANSSDHVTFARVQSMPIPSCGVSHSESYNRTLSTGATPASPFASTADDSWMAQPSRLDFESNVPVAVASASTAAQAGLPTEAVVLVEPIVEPSANELPPINDEVRIANNNNDDIEMPRPCSFNSNRGSSDNSNSPASSKNLSQKLTNGLARGMEMLFGDTNPRRGNGFDPSNFAGTILPRTLLPWSVIRSEATNMWIATVNTSQKSLDSNNVEEASKAVRAFSVLTEKQATCLAKAWAPPRMLPFSECSGCYICESKFAVFRRACHCRNCGVCVCTACTIPWPSKMVPETYNIKKESFVNICKSCDWLCTNFRLALLEGDHDKAVAIHATGNVNLVTPFANVKGELFYPVHCAALGGDLDLLKWLIDDNCCPIKSVRVSGRARDSSGSFTEIATSKGRSVLRIALEMKNIAIVRFLVVEKEFSLANEKDITKEILFDNLDLVLQVLPSDVMNVSKKAPGEKRKSQDSNVMPNWLPIRPSTDDRNHESSGNLSNDRRGSNRSDSDDSSLNDCIICFSNPINCVATPCGHQICCMECSSNISTCPVCAVPCSFMRVFRP